MSCGGCSSHQILQLSNAPERKTRPFRLLELWRRCLKAFERLRRHRIWLEFEKARQRRALLELDERLLRDIGITREQAVQEARKRFRW